MFFIFCLSLLIALFIAFIIFERFREKQFISKIKKLFENHPELLPVIESGNSYGFPTYNFRFSSKNQYETAEQLGILSDIKSYVVEANKGIKEFSADAAVNFFVAESKYPITHITFQ